MTKSTPAQEVNWVRIEAITVPDQALDRKVMMRVADWIRIRQKVTTIAPTFSWIPLASSALISAGFTAIATIITLWASDSTPKDWIWSALGLFSFFAIITGVTYAVMHRDQFKFVVSEGKKIHEDMKQIESVYSPGTFD